MILEIRIGSRMWFVSKHRVVDLMTELDGVIAVWKRELLVFRREISRVVASIASPLMWLLLFGSGLSASVNVGETGYQKFIFPGIVIMSVLFSSVFYGLYIVWDRKIDVLKAVLVAPVSRIAIFFGKVLGGSTDSLIQSTILIVIGLFFVAYTPLGMILTLLTVLLTAIGFVALGLTIGSMFESFEGFQLISTFLVFPLFFLSGALFPLDKNLPGWLMTVSKFDPVTYAVDAARSAILGQSAFPIYFDLGVLTVFAVVMVFIGSIAFSRMK